MSENNIINSEWGDDVDAILQAINLNSVVLAKQHKKQFFILQKRLKFFRLPSIILSSANAVFSVGLTTFLKQKDVSLICCLISLITTIITSTELFLSIEKQMGSELDSSKSYQILSIEICKILNLAENHRNTDASAFLDKIVAEYEKLLENSHIIEKTIKDNLIDIYKPYKETKDPKDTKDTKDTKDVFDTYNEFDTTYPTEPKDPDDSIKNEECTTIINISDQFEQTTSTTSTNSTNSFNEDFSNDIEESKKLPSSNSTDTFTD